MSKSKEYLEDMIPEGEKKIFGILNEEEGEKNKKNSEEEDMENNNREDEEVLLPYGGKLKAMGRKRIVIDFEDAPPLQMQVDERAKFISRIGDAVRKVLNIKATSSNQESIKAKQEIEKIRKEEK